ncbi:hypothetical protein [Halorhodospira halophila]|uniref:Uncharacterized protein n=1 Tax=Halorhodospira halophila (strain DSM 244 / SL1) TaxID=349124 RepID=A1WXC8_HALHL|nr:hypothetical protein [Halorhodospira halophila]ABM62340.1 conserved hypothetical protein [Halorhodospira halophila SL1]MBK1730059.1 hypothetical protein [Halorhodospira halophila]
MGNRCALVTALTLLGGLVPGMALALTPERVEQWQEAVGALHDHAAEQGMEDWHPASELRGVGKSETAFREAAKTLEDPASALELYGYEGAAAWAEEGARIYRALIALEAGDPRELQAQLEGAIEQIEENPHLGDAAKGEIIADIKAQRERVTDFLASVPDADREAVATRQERLMELLRP